MAELVVLNGVATGTVFVLGDVPAVVGRSPEAHLCIADPWISSMHAMFERREDGLWVVDLESRNGVFLGDERVGEARVPDGAVVRLGRTEVRLTAGHASEGEIPRAPDGAPPPASRRDTSRSDATMTIAPRRPTPAAASQDPLAVARRPATVLRMAIDDAGLQGAPDAGWRLRAALDAATGAAAREGAAVTRLAGIGVLAIFGLDGHSGDELEHALAAARAARRAVRDAGGLELRAGIAAGPVLAGKIEGSEGAGLAALGPAAERAERLAALARAGEILVGTGAGEPAPAALGRVGPVRIGDLQLEVFRDETP